MRHTDQDARGPFAALIRDGRQRRGWTQEQLADASGVSRSTLIRWESGEITDPEIGPLIAVLEALGLDADAAYRALGWLTESDQPGEAIAPPQTWVDAIRAIVALTDMSPERRLERILDLLDEYETAQRAG